MGPIDFTKFEAVKGEYATSFNFTTLANKLNALRTKFPLFTQFIEYFDTKEKLEKIVLANEQQLRSYRAMFDSDDLQFEYLECLKPATKQEKKACKSCTNCNDNAYKRNFHSEIMNILNYNVKGKEALRKVYSKIGMKTCYVCNAQYALSIEPEDPSIKSDSKSVQDRYQGKFQFDHCLPKDKYPALSISLFNLLPICSSCNTIKGDRELGIDFFETDESHWENKFRFRIIENSLSEFLLQRETLKIDLEDNHTYPSEMTSLSTRYDLKGIYNTQIDQIEELIIRKLKYSETYKEKLYYAFPEMFKTTTIDDRILLGTYKKEEGIHKRPMSKFLQDIEKQLEEYFQREILKNK
ncbi:MAG: hypothetical protein ACO1O6_13860 [Bacteroidota bacterium]